MYKENIQMNSAQNIIKFPIVLNVMLVCPLYAQNVKLGMMLFMNMRFHFAVLIVSRTLITIVVPALPIKQHVNLVKKVLN